MRADYPSIWAGVLINVLLFAAYAVVFLELLEVPLERGERRTRVVLERFLSPAEDVRKTDACGCPDPSDAVCSDPCTSCMCARLDRLSVDRARELCDRECDPAMSGHR